MINYIVKTEDLEYMIFSEKVFWELGHQFYYNGRLCTVISRDGRI